MPGHVIGILKGKGGVGASTTATNLARALELAGHRVMLADDDPLGISTLWGQADDSKSVHVVHAPHDDLEAVVRKARREFDYIVLDGRPAWADRTALLLRLCDLVLLPIRPHGADLWGTQGIVSGLLHLQQVNAERGLPGRPKAAYLVTQVDSRTTEAADILQVLARYPIPTLPVLIHHRVAYPRALQSGLSVLDTEPPSGGARKEFEAVVRSILELLHGEAN